MVVPQYRLTLRPPGREGTSNLKNKKQNSTQGSRSSWRLRKQNVSISRPGAFLPCLPSHSCFLQQRLPYPPTIRSALYATHPGCAALRAHFLLIYVPPGHEPFGCSEDHPVPLARLLCCMDAQYGFNSKLPWGIFRGAFGRLYNGEAVSQGTEPVVRWPT